MFWTWSNLSDCYLHLHFIRKGPGQVGEARKKLSAEVTCAMRELQCYNMQEYVRLAAEFLLVGPDSILDLL